MKLIRNAWLPATATLICMSMPAAADGLKATAEIKGCTDPGISGKATLMEKTSP